MLVLAATPLAAQIKASDGLAALDAGDAEGARAIWDPLAGRGDVLAQHNLAVLKLTGQGGPRDEAAALALLEQAAEAGHAPAQSLLAALALERGDTVTAVRWFTKRAEAGDMQAQFALAQLRDATGASEEAARWYRAAAEAGLATAQFALGQMLAEEGAEEAERWLDAASGQGMSAAQHALAVWLSARDTPDDAARARELYVQAARAGHGPSMFNLALMQARGQGGEASFRRAYAWAVAAERVGHIEAAKLRDALRDVMPEEVLRAAEEMVDACLEGAQDCG